MNGPAVKPRGFFSGAPFICGRSHSLCFLPARHLHPVPHSRQPALSVIIRIMEQREFDEDTLILDRAGEPVNPGWARKDIFLFPPESGRSRENAFSSSCKYVIFSRSFMFAFELCDRGVLLFAALSAISLPEKRLLSKTLNFPFPEVPFSFPLRESSTLRFKRNNFLFEIIMIGRGNRILKIDFFNPEHNRILRGEFVLSPPAGAQSLWTNSIRKDIPGKFRLGCVSPWWNTEGVIQHENTDLLFTKNRSWGISLWNKVAYPGRDIHYRAAGCGTDGGRLLGFSAGFGTENCASGTENAFFVNGIIHKLELVTFHIILKNGAIPTRFTSSDLRLDMSFYPVQQHKLKSSNLFQSDRTSEAFGFFSGAVILDDGSKLAFERLAGFVEIRRTRNG